MRAVSFSGIIVHSAVSLTMAPHHSDLTAAQQSSTCTKAANRWGSFKKWPLTNRMTDPEARASHFRSHLIDNALS